MATRTSSRGTNTRLADVTKPPELRLSIGDTIGDVRAYLDSALDSAMSGHAIAGCELGRK
jgi:hypothetical protein